MSLPNPKEHTTYYLLMRLEYQVYTNCEQIHSDKLQGVIRNPFAFYFAIQRGFSGPIQTLGTEKANNLVDAHTMSVSFR